MTWEIEYTDEFGEWWDCLSQAAQETVDSYIGLLEQSGPRLGFPHSSDVRGSKHGNLRELRVQYAGRPFRILYAFDPRRMAILLLGGDKTGNDRWYETFVPIADRLYDRHLADLAKEGER